MGKRPNRGSGNAAAAMRTALSARPDSSSSALSIRRLHCVRGALHGRLQARPGSRRMGAGRRLDLTNAREVADMTKKWSSTASMDGKTKRQASKERRRAENDVEKWLQEQGAVESVTFDEDTGRPMRTFTIDLTK